VPGAVAGIAAALVGVDRVVRVRDRVVFVTFATSASTWLVEGAPEGVAAPADVRVDVVGDLANEELLELEPPEHGDDRR
jgi:hypothetical protein